MKCVCRVERQLGRLGLLSDQRGTTRRAEMRSQRSSAFWVWLLFLAFFLAISVAQPQPDPNNRHVAEEGPEFNVGDARLDSNTENVLPGWRRICGVGWCRNVQIKPYPKPAPS